MKHFAGAVISLLGFLFGLLVLVFTGMQTWLLIYEVTQDAITATVGLVLFEGSTLYWWATFKNHSEGLMQMALSLLLFIFGLLLMVGSNGLHLGAVDATFLGEKTPQRLILLAAIVNLVGKLLFPLFAPIVMQEIWQRALQGMLLARALMQTEATINKQAQRIAARLGAAMAESVEIDLMTAYQLPHRRQLTTTTTTTNDDNSDGEGTIIEGETTRPQPDQSDHNLWQSFLDWIGQGNQPAPSTNTPIQAEPLVDYDDVEIAPAPRPTNGLPK